MKDNTRQLELDMNGNTQKQFSSGIEIIEDDFKVTLKKVTIASVVDINPRLSVSSKPEPNKLVSFVPMASVSEESISIESPIDRPYSEVAKGFTPFQRGDILIAKITPCFENGKMAHAINLPREIGFGSTEFHVLRPRKELDGHYLFHLLRDPSVRQVGSIKMKGAAGQRRVPADFFASLQIPLPPLEEQRRIAQILDAADELRAKRRQALAELDTFLQSTFLDMFGDPVTNPKGWEEKPIGSIGEVQGGIQLTPNRSKFNLRLPYLRVANVYRNYLWLNEIKTIGLTEQEFQRIQLIAGDILIVEGHGNPDEIGRCAIWDGSIKDCVHQNHLIRVRLNQKNLIPCFVSIFLNTRGGSIRLKSQARTTSGLNTISVAKVRQTKILCPPPRTPTKICRHS